MGPAIETVLSQIILAQAAAGSAVPASAAPLSAAPASAAAAASGAIPPASAALDTLPGGLTATEYVVFGAIGLFILLFVVRALRSKPPVLDSTPDPVEALTAPERTKAQIEAEARRAFSVNQVMVDESTPEHTRVRVAPPEAAQPPTGGRKDGPRKPPAAEAAPAPAPDHSEAAGKTLREGLARTHDGFVKSLGKLFGAAKTIDDALLADLEEALFTADIGVRTSQKLVERVQAELDKKALKDPAQVWRTLKDQISEILIQGAAPLDFERAKPFVIMVVGVNGAGKTTTIGKLARRYAAEGKKVILAAGDTYRAAAVEQLEVWSERAGVPVIRGREKQDPSSVIFEAVERATREGYDVCIADTAGRLQAKKELMDELAKIHRAIGKAADGAPHEVWLVLDATNGQNAISQVEIFTEVVDVTGIVLTKLDGTAKGGVVIGITDEMAIPVRYIGIGEKAEDLRAFDAPAFADALLGDA